MSEIRTKIEAYSEKFFDGGVYPGGRRDEGILFFVIGSDAFCQSFEKEAGEVLANITWQVIAVPELQSSEARDIFTENTELLLEEMENKIPGIRCFAVFVAQMSSELWEAPDRISENLMDCLENLEEDEFSLKNAGFYGIIDKKYQRNPKIKVFTEIQRGWSNPMFGWKNIYHLKQGRRDQDGRGACHTVCMQVLRNLVKLPDVLCTEGNDYPWEALGYYEQRFTYQLLSGILLKIYQNQVREADGRLQAEFAGMARQAVEKSLNEAVRKFYQMTLDESCLDYLPLRLEKDCGGDPYFSENQVRGFVKAVLEDNYQEKVEAEDDIIGCMMRTSIGSLPYILDSQPAMQEIFSGILSELFSSPVYMSGGNESEFVRALKAETEEKKKELLKKWKQCVDSITGNTMRPVIDEITEKNKKICGELIALGGGQGHEYFEIDRLYDRGVVPEIYLRDSFDTVLEKLDRQKLLQELSSPEFQTNYIQRFLNHIQEKASNAMRFAQANSEVIQYEWLTGFRDVDDQPPITVLQDELFKTGNLQVLFRRKWNSYRELRIYKEAIQTEQAEEV